MRTYTRSKEEGSSLYVSFQHNGRTYQWCTKTSDPQKAQERGESYRQKVIDNDMGAVSTMKSKGGFPSIGRVIEYYKANAIDTTEKTRRECSQTLLRMVQQFGIRESQTVDALTPAVWQAYRRKRTAGLDGPALESAKRSTNADLAKARSLFSRNMTFAYQNEFSMPDLTGFKTMQFFRAPTSCYRSRPADQLASVLDAAKAQGPAFEAMVYLALFAGLRCSEAIGCKWDWITPAGDVYLITVPNIYKDRESRTIPLSREIYTRLKEIGDPSSGSVVRPGCRERNLKSELSSILRKAGLSVRKPLHELRKQFGAEIASRHGLYVAQKLLGHASPVLTSNTYSALISLPVPLSSTQVLSSVSQTPPPAQ